MSTEGPTPSASAATTTQVAAVDAIPLARAVVVRAARRRPE